MRLISCHIEGFGRLHATDFSFDPGMTVFCEQNGYGKSTVAAFLRAMFYGLPTGTARSHFNDRIHYYPFAGGQFGGNLVFEMQGHTYRIERFFDRRSATADTLAVFRDGRAYDGFGGDIGGAVFGVDEDAFLRTVFITAERAELGASAGISEKLHQRVEGTDGGNTAEDAKRRLECAVKTLKASRGSNDRISRLTDERRRLAEQIENLSATEGALGLHYEEAQEAALALRQARAECRAAAEARALVEQHEVYRRYCKEAEEAQARLQQKEAAYPNRLPTEEDADTLRRVGGRCLALKEQYAAAAEQDAQCTDRLRDIERDFPAGVPDADALATIGAQVETYEAAQDRVRRAYAAKDKPGGAPLPACLTARRAPLVCLCLGALLAVAGACMTAVLLPVGIALLALGCCGIPAFLLLRRHGRRQSALDAEIAAAESELDRADRLLDAVFSPLSLDGKDYRAQYFALNNLVARYHAMCDEKRRCIERIRQTETMRDEQNDTVRALLRGFGMAELSPDEAVRRMDGDRAELASLRLEAERARGRAAAYRREHDLTETPPETIPDIAEAEQKVSDLQKRQNDILSTISDAEAELTRLNGLRAELAAVEESLAQARQRHRVLSLALECLNRAEQNLVERYVAPVRDRFLAYAAQIEAVTGTQIRMDGDFHLQIEENGAYHGEQHNSAGMHAVCALCFRLALIDNMFRTEQPFIIMDDPFVHLDELHMQRVGELLRHLATERQFIYFCCHPSRKI